MKWTPLNEETPIADGVYLITIQYQKLKLTTKAFFGRSSWYIANNNGVENISQYVIAWMPLPEPF